jgi:hypothetical protein
VLSGGGSSHEAMPVGPTGAVIPQAYKGAGARNHAAAVAAATTVATATAPILPLGFAMPRSTVIRTLAWSRGARFCAREDAGWRDAPGNAS